MHQKNPSITCAAMHHGKKRCGHTAMPPPKNLIHDLH